MLKSKPELAKALKDAPLDDLENTVEVLQKAHDHVETHHFDIERYGSSGEGSCCYIGSVRYQQRHQGASNQASDLALTALDNIAEHKGQPTNPRIICEGRLGSTAEALGFASYTYGRTDEGALSVYRDAIRMVCKEVEKRRATT